MKKILVAVLIIFLSACVPPTVIPNFVVSRDVPENPSFTVLPFNEYHYQIAFANKIEEALINLGVRVIKQSPKKKEIIKGKGMEVNEDQKALSSVEMLTAKRSQEASVIETYTEYEKFTADYIICSNELSKRVEIIKRGAGEILASFTIEIFGINKNIQRYNFEKAIHDSLESLGIQVKDLPSPYKPIKTHFNRKLK